MQVQNGEQIILGGLIDKTQGQITRKLPILGDIPLFKYLFSYKKNIKETQEMVIVIAPRIVDLQPPSLEEQKRIESIIDFSKTSLDEVLIPAQNANNAQDSIQDSTNAPQ